MTLAQFVLDPMPEGDVVVLGGDEGRHAATVRRIGVGETVLLTDGRGRRREGVVTGVGRSELTLSAGPVEVMAPPDPRLVVVQALPKGDRAELAIELMTELGVDEIVPWSAQRSVVQWRGEREAKSLQRWRRSALEAGKQSRRARFPSVADLADTRAVCTRMSSPSVTAFILHESAETALATVTLPSSGDLLLVVGPEGGISPEELAAFTAAGATAVRMGAEVMRTSTAGGAALAAVSVRLDRWR